MYFLKTGFKNLFKQTFSYLKKHQSKVNGILSKCLHVSSLASIRER